MRLINQLQSRYVFIAVGFPDSVLRNEQGQGRVRGSDANVFCFDMAAELRGSLGFPQIPPTPFCGRQGWGRSGESEIQ